jgi:hypothetical protein
MTNQVRDAVDVTFGPRVGGRGSLRPAAADQRPGQHWARAGTPPDTRATRPGTSTGNDDGIPGL